MELTLHITPRQQHMLIAAIGKYEPRSDMITRELLALVETIKTAQPE